MTPIRIAILTTDKREHLRSYDSVEPAFGTAPEALLQGLATLSDVEVHVISCFQKKVQSPPKLAPNIYFHSLHVPKLGWLRSGYQGCIRAVRRKLKEIQPDVVHGQGTERDCAICAVLSSFPNVLTIHGNMQIIADLQQARAFSFYWLASRLERFSLARTNGVVCITEYTRKAVANQAARTWTVPNAVDASFFEITSTPASVPEILYVGNICLRKNQNAFIQAMDGIAASQGRKFIFLGLKEEADPYSQEFSNLVAARSWCRYDGMADRKTLKEYLGRASLLVLASLEDNCPMVVLEAMAAGVPVIASAVGGVPELIEDGVTGILCDPTSPGSMQKAVERFFANGNEPTNQILRARKTALERFHPSKIAQKHCEIYREILERPS